MTQAERITALETEVRLLKEEYRKDMEEMKGKLDSLLALKSKGQGVFWLATTIFGTGFALFITYVGSLLK